MKFFFKALLLMLFSATVAANQYYDSYIDQANELFEQRKYNEAIDIYSKAIKEDKAQMEGFFKRGVCKYEIGDFRGAEADLGKALKINNNYGDAYMYIGLCYLKAEYPVVALENFNYAVRCNKEEYRYYYYRGVAALDLKSDYEFAKENFEKVVKINPEHYKSFIYLGGIEHKFKNFDVAVTNYKSALEAHPDDPLIYFNMAITYKAMKNYYDACASLRYADELGYSDLDDMIKKVCKKVGS